MTGIERQSEPSGDQLQQCRQDIDRVDGVIAALLRERVRLALSVGRMKQQAGEPLRVPARELAVLARVRTLAGAPLDADRLERIFQAIIDETCAAERQLLDADRTADVA